MLKPLKSELQKSIDSSCGKLNSSSNKFVMSPTHPKPSFCRGLRNACGSLKQLFRN
ncbi:hypothetical protein CSC44_5454 [Pseudomonas aeruginosa]|nr:hypothetical protein CSC44_5454 [Pseudomonas aeruginosa]